MIHASGLARRFGRVHAVKDVSFDASPGRVLGIVGANGAGKSTTLRMLAGLLRPDAGSIDIAGVDALKHPARARAKIGYLPESGAVYTDMTPEGYIRYRARLQAIRRPRHRVDRAIELCRLESVRNRPIAELSKGFTQRTALAGALVHAPPVLILDEPTNGLDVAQLHESRGVLRELGKQSTMLISSHLLGEIEQLCDHVVVLAQGTLVAKGTPHDIRSSALGARVVFEAPADADLAPLVALVGDRLETERTGAWVRVTGQLDADTPDVCERVARLALELGIPLRLLKVRKPSLEHAIATLITSQRVRNPERDTP